ncbi:MAG: phosphoribosylanthranilate isomerase [Fulvivirga sp.]
MALKTHVLISSVNNLSDARYCAGMHVNYIGFGFEKTDNNYIPRETFKELTEWLSGVDFVGEFSHYETQDVRMTLQDYGTKYVQIKDKTQVEQLQLDGFTVFLTIDINDWVSLEGIRPNYLVVESSHEKLTKEELNIIKNLSATRKVFIGAGITKENVESILSETNAHGVALQGGDEIRPGYKDYDELADILETLEVDDMAIGN